MEKTGTIKYPAFINECAVYIGKLRTLFNYELHEADSKFKRGDRTELVDILGVKGEMIFSYYLHENNIPYQSARLLSNKPVSSFDILVGEKRIDVKTARTDATELMVNCDAHNKNKGIDTYVFVQIIDPETARYWVLKHEEISKWDKRYAGYTDAYFKNINDL